MSIEFALKDLTRKWSQSMSYIKTIAIITTISVFFIYLFNGLGSLIFSEATQLYNFTTSDTFYQFFQFMMYSTIVLTIFWVVSMNHSIISHKTRDLATMKAVGTMQKKLNSFYLTEILIVDLIGLILGVIIGFLIYVLTFFIYGLMGIPILFYIDFFFVPILILLSLIFTFFVNGFELRKISEKRYAQISSGDIYNGYVAVGGLKLVPKMIAQIGYKARIAVTNLTRKKSMFIRSLIIVTMVMSILVTIGVGDLLIGFTAKSQIEGAQSDSIIAIGHNTLLNTYRDRYAEFSNASLSFTNEEYDFSDTNYLFDEDVVDTLEMLSKYSEVNYWDKRFFVYEYAHEIDATVIISEGGEYATFGLNRWAHIPVIGVEFKDYIESWAIYGSLNKTEETALVGDTLAASFFVAPTYQSIDLLSGTPQRYKVTGVFYDSFCAGNATYINLTSLQSDYSVPGMINLAVLGIPNSIDRTELIANLTEDIQAELGTDFGVIDLTETFQQNVDSIDQLHVIFTVFIIIMIILVIWSLNYHQSANFDEKIRDFAVIRAIGAPGSFIKKVLFYEDLMILGIASPLSLGISMLFDNLLLSNQAVLPPLSLVFIIWGIITLILLGIIALSIFPLYNRFKKVKLNYLRTFDRYK
jgi:ABC-type lipoprotein release transport system permease subunit